MPKQLNLQDLIDISHIAIYHYKLDPNAINQDGLLRILGDINHFSKYPHTIKPNLEFTKKKESNA